MSRRNSHRNRIAPICQFHAGVPQCATVWHSVAQCATLFSRHPQIIFPQEIELSRPIDDDTPLLLDGGRITPYMNQPAVIPSRQ